LPRVGDRYKEILEDLDTGNVLLTSSLKKTLEDRDQRQEVRFRLGRMGLLRGVRAETAVPAGHEQHRLKQDRRDPSD
jgi:hypothetical protein